jgi:hypothetical protein
VIYQGTQQTGQAPSGASERAEAERRLAERVGLEIARVFYKHEIPRESPSGMNN